MWKKHRDQHYIVAGDGAILSSDVVLTPRMIQKLHELSPMNVVVAPVR
jgi:hypothetical protein